MKFCLQEGEKMAQKTIQKSIKLDEETHQMALVLAGEVDCSFSELVRISLCVAAPQIVASPFIRKIAIEDVEVNHIKEVQR